jgi:hypothetical protein
VERKGESQKEKEMNKYEWTVQPVRGDVGARDTLAGFAQELEKTLNAVEEGGFEVDDIMDSPRGRAEGVVIIGKKPRGLPGRQPA